MNSAELEAQLSEVESKLATEHQKLDAIVEEFRNELPSLAEPWMRKELEGRISDNAQKIQAMGVERLKELKAKLSNLFSDLTRIAREETADRKDWPHYRPEMEPGNQRGENEHFFDKAFRNVISHLGGLLNQYGLLEIPKGYVSTWESRGGGKFRYAVNPGFMDMKVVSRQKFTDACGPEKELKRQLLRLRQELAQVKAKELWDSV